MLAQQQIDAGFNKLMELVNLDQSNADNIHTIAGELVALERLVDRIVTDQAKFEIDVANNDKAHIERLVNATHRGPGSSQLVVHASHPAAEVVQASGGPHIELLLNHVNQLLAEGQTQLAREFKVVS